MADTDTEQTLQQTLEQLLVGVKETSDALRSNSEAGVLLANTLSATMDDKTRLKVLDIATDPNRSVKDRRLATRDIMASHISKLSQYGKETRQINTRMPKIVALLQKLTLTTDAIHSSLSAISKKSTKEVSNHTSVNTPRTLSQQRLNTLATYRANYWSRKYNKNLARSPLIRSFVPSSVLNIAKNTAAYGDAARIFGGYLHKSGFKTAGKSVIRGGRAIGRLAASATSGSIGALGLLAGGAAVAAVVSAAVAITKRFMQSGASAYAMEGLTGGKYNWNYQEYYRSRAGRYGLSGDEAFRKQQEYAKHGVRSADEVLSGIRAEKYFGVSNMAQYFQNLKRTTTDVDKFGSDLGKSLFRLQGIVHKTSMGMDEMVQHQTGFIEQFKGASDAFNTDQIVSIFSRFSKLLNSKEITGAELGNIYSLGQKVNFNTLLTTARFAEMGGYNFGSASTLVGKAYKIRRMGSGDLEGRAELLRSALKGIYQLRGATNFKGLDDEGKAIVSEQLIPQLLGADVAKFPNLEEVMSALDAGAKTTESGADVVESIEKAKKTDLDSIVSSMNLLIQPVNHIKEFLFASVEGIAAKRAVVDKAKREGQRDELLSKQATANIYVTNASSYDLTFTSNAPGDAATVYSGPTPTKVGTNR